MKKRIVKKHADLLWSATTDWDAIQSVLDDVYDEEGDVYDFRPYGKVAKPVRGKRIKKLIAWLERDRRAGRMPENTTFVWRWDREPFVDIRKTLRDRRFYHFSIESQSGLLCFYVRRWRSPAEERHDSRLLRIRIEHHAEDWRRERGVGCI